MSVYNKVTNSVADAVSKIMNEKLHPNQQKLDVHEPEKDKLTAHDFKKLRAKKEMETGIKKEIAADRLEQKAKKKMEEEAEQLQEYQSKDGVYKHQGTYGRAKDMEAGETDWDKEDKLARSLLKPAAKKRAYGAHQKRRTNTKLYKEMIESLKAGGIKSLFKTIAENKIEEEASQEEFTKELADQKAKFDGKKKTADVAKPAVQAVQNEATHTEIQVIDMTDGSQKPVINIVDLEEKALTEPETKKKEEVVKSMKKGLSGFKERYGNRAKSVIYATATKIAKEKA
jgi:hypothetical protein